jgi:hypothetical protein
LAFVCTTNRPIHPIDNQIDNQSAHDIIAGSGHTFPPDNFKRNELADFFERRLPAYFKQRRRISDSYPAIFVDILHNPHLSFRESNLAFLFRPDALHAQTSDTFAHSIDADRHPFNKIFQGAFPERAEYRNVCGAIGDCALHTIKKRHH